MKKRLTQHEEFEIMKIVLDKFMLFGIFIMALGVISLLKGNMVMASSLMVGGAGILILFIVLIVKEYEIIK